MFVAACLISSGSSTSAAAARWRATAAPSASSGTGPPTRSSVASASECWPSSRSPSDDLPSPSPGRGEQGEEHGRGGSTGLDSWGWKWAPRTRQWRTMTLKTEDNFGDVRWIQASEDGGGEGVCRKRHLPLPRTVKISIACFLHVDDGNVFVVVFIFYFIINVFCFVLFFSRERPSSSTCCYGFVCEGELFRLIKEPDRHLVGPRYGQTLLSCWGQGCLGDVLWE